MGKLSLDVICSAAFGVDVHSQVCSIRCCFWLSFSNKIPGGALVCDEHALRLQ